MSAAEKIRGGRYAFVRHPDESLGRDQPRHIVDPSESYRTLCGQMVGWDWGTTIPLARDCRSCGRVAAARAAAFTREFGSPAPPPGAHPKTCHRCGREATRGFTKVGNAFSLSGRTRTAQRLNMRSGPAVWECAPGVGCKAAAA